MKRSTPWNSPKWSGPPEGRCGKHWLDEDVNEERDENEPEPEKEWPKYTRQDWEWILEEQRLTWEKNQQDKGQA